MIWGVLYYLITICQFANLLNSFDNYGCYRSYRNLMVVALGSLLWPLVWVVFTFSIIKAWREVRNEKD